MREGGGGIEEVCGYMTGETGGTEMREDGTARDEGIAFIVSEQRSRRKSKSEGENGVGGGGKL